MLSGGPRNITQASSTQFITSLPQQFQQTTPGGELSQLLTTLKSLIDTYGPTLGLEELANNDFAQFHADHVIEPTVPGDFQIMNAFKNKDKQYISDDELLTWGFMKSFIDNMFPIGCIQFTQNFTLPISFGGYIQWDYVGPADGRYLRLYGGGSSGQSYIVGSQNPGRLLAHDHATPSYTLPAQTVTSGNNTVFTATTSNTSLTPSGAVTRQSVGTDAALLQTSDTGLLFTPHTHDVTIPAQTIPSFGVSSTGAATNECNNFTLAIFTRIA